MPAGPWAFDGTAITKRDTVCISVDDIGFRRGYVVYDFVRTYNGSPFLLNEHLERLERSLDTLGLVLPLEKSLIQDIIAELLVKNSFPESAVSLYVTPGVTDGFDLGTGQPRLLITVDELSPLPEHLYTDGVSIITHQHARELPNAKTSGYLTAVQLDQTRRDSGAFEILFLDQDRVLECSTSNIFAVIDGTLVTPDHDVLPGTTRNYVLQLARDNDIEAQERKLSLDELLAADEVFLCASKKEIIPVVKVNDATIGLGAPGDTTKRLLTIFRTSVPLPSEPVGS